MLQHLGRHIAKLLLIVPNLIEKVQVGLRKLRFIHYLCVTGYRISTLIPKINSGEARKGHVGCLGS